MRKEAFDLKQTLNQGMSAAQPYIQQGTQLALNAYQGLPAMAAGAGVLTAGGMLAHQKLKDALKLNPEPLAANPQAGAEQVIKGLESGYNIPPSVSNVATGEAQLAKPQIMNQLKELMKHPNAKTIGLAGAGAVGATALSQLMGGEKRSAEGDLGSGFGGLGDLLNNAPVTRPNPNMVDTTGVISPPTPKIPTEDIVSRISDSILGEQPNVIRPQIPPDKAKLIAALRRTASKTQETPQLTLPAPSKPRKNTVFVDEGGNAGKAQDPMLKKLHQKLKGQGMGKRPSVKINGGKGRREFPYSEPKVPLDYKTLSDSYKPKVPMPPVEAPSLFGDIKDTVGPELAGYKDQAMSKLKGLLGGVPTTGGIQQSILKAKTKPVASTLNLLKGLLAAAPVVATGAVAGARGLKSLRGMMKPKIVEQAAQALPEAAAALPAAPMLSGFDKAKQFASQNALPLTGGALAGAYGLNKLTQDPEPKMAEAPYKETEENKKRSSGWNNFINKGVQEGGEALSLLLKSKRV